MSSSIHQRRRLGGRRASAELPIGHLTFPGDTTFDITANRKAASLLQFCAGSHHCLGAALARCEISEALPVVASRLGPPSIAGTVTWRPPLGIYGLERAAAAFRPIECVSVHTGSDS